MFEVVTSAQGLVAAPELVYLFDAFASVSPSGQDVLATIPSAKIQLTCQAKLRDACSDATTGMRRHNRVETPMNYTSDWYDA